MIIDPRVVKQARILVDYSTRVKQGDVVCISGTELAKPLILEIYRQVLLKKAKEVITNIGFDEMTEIFYDSCTEEQLKQFPEVAMHLVENSDVWIGISAPKNTRHLSQTHPKKLSIHQKTLQPLLDRRIEHTRWVVTAFPTEALAQEADMSIRKFTDFLFRTIVNVNWQDVKRRQQRLARLLTKGSIVKIVGEDTDISLSILNRPVIADNGEQNMPGGEVFTSVVEDSANGFIHFTYPAIYHGREVDSVKLWFKNGKVIKAKAVKGESILHHMLEMDEGARFLGEIGFGNNFYIDRFVKNILFDEKIGGTIHLALGRSYKETKGKNQSALHWDMIKDLRKDGQIYLEGKLIQKNGRWVV